jgi:hypothetical protein
MYIYIYIDDNYWQTCPHTILLEHIQHKHHYFRSFKINNATNVISHRSSYFCPSVIGLFSAPLPWNAHFSFPSCPIARGRFMFMFFHACHLCFGGWGGVAWANEFTFPLDAALHTSSDSLSHLVTCLMLCWTYSLLHFVVQFSSQRLFEVKIIAYQPINTSFMFFRHLQNVSAI